VLSIAWPVPIALDRVAGESVNVFAMRWSFLSPFLIVCAVVSLPVQADPDDVEGSHDYPGWARMTGFEITDYDEDNPASFTFSVSRPSADDPDHLEAMPVQGHRYVIQYEWSNSGQPPSLLKTQRHFEKLATAAGYKVEKNGKAGNANETFHLMKVDQDIWVYFSPAGRTHSLTVVETKKVGQPPAATPPPTQQVTVISPAAPTSAPILPPSLTPPTIVAPVVAPGATDEDPLATELLKKGRVVLPLSFLPGKPEIAADSKPVIDRVIAILKLHPDVAVTIEGHTDLTGDENFNLDLSRQRAQEVRTMLVAGKISRKRLTAVGLGGTEPIADEGTAEGRQKNRRIELVVKSGTGAKAAPTKEVSSAKKSSIGDPATDGSNDFHAPAPDGVNYYPDANKIVVPPPPTGKPPEN